MIYVKSIQYLHSCSYRISSERWREQDFDRFKKDRKRQACRGGGAVTDCWNEIKKEKKKKKKEKGKKKTKKAASQGKQINSSVGWSRVFSGLAPNICFARPPIPAEQYTGVHLAYLQKSRELPTKLPPSCLPIYRNPRVPTTHPISIGIRVCVCVCHPFLSTERWSLPCQEYAGNSSITIVITASVYPPRYASVETNTRFSDVDECHFFK